MGLKLSIAGVPVEFQPAFLFGAVVLALSRIDRPVLLVEWIAVVAVSVLLHELGHAFAFRKLGRASQIRIHAFGGLTSPERGPPLTGLQDACVSLAGPAVGLIAGGLVWAIVSAGELEPSSELLSTLIRDLLWVNIGWSIFNLFPIVPLDGGHILRGLLRHALGDRGDQVSLAISLIAAVGGIALAWNYGYTFAAIMFAWFALDGFRLLRRRRPAPLRALEERARELLNQQKPAEALAVLEGAPDRKQLDPLLYGAVLAISGRPREAIEPLRLAFERDREPAAGDLLIEALLETQELDTALGTLAARRGEALSDQAHARVEGALYAAQRFEEAHRTSELRFDRFQTPAAAYNAACSLARLSQLEPALKWLRRAAEAGFSDPAQLERDGDLAELRSRPEAAEIAERIRKNAAGTP